MKTKKLKRFSTANLIVGYVMAFVFVLLVCLNRAPEVFPEQLAETNSTVYAEDLFTGIHSKNLERERLYVAGHPLDYVYVPLNTELLGSAAGGENNLLIEDFNNETYVEGHRADRRRGSREDSDIIRDVHNIRDGAYATNQGGVGREITGEIDRGLLDRRIREADLDLDAVGDLSTLVDYETKVTLNGQEVTVEELFEREEVDFTNLTLAKDQSGDFELDVDLLAGPPEISPFEPSQKGAVHAYNYPSQGIGAGVGNTAIGAGVGAAGLSAGIGEALYEGQIVPALGGIGTSTPVLVTAPFGVPTAFPRISPVRTDGVGGLTSGAGAGGAAGLTTGLVEKGLGLGSGSGAGENGGYSEGRKAQYSHLPKDGALHIMMHVDGSGSILNTRQQLETMRETLLKDALLPYYSNDEELYNRRVTLVDGNGERTLQFFNTAASKANVLALAFQDEASPAYHLPTFNKKPQDDYSDDLNQLKSSLGRHGGLYRGVMFQVDRGRTFAKSFKEFVQCAWQGSGYLKNDNLKKYYWDENRFHITNKDGIVFSDVYHAKDSGDPQYYLNLIFEASKKIGLDLDIYAGGLNDGKYTSQD